jgi:hypothetical protein
MNQTRELQAFQNVAASGIAVCDLGPTLFGSTMECIHLNMGGTFTASMMTSIQLKANGKVIWDTTGATQSLINAYKGQPNSANMLTLDFMEMKARTVNAFQAGGIDLSRDSGITQLRLEITISGATAPTLTGVAEVSPAVPMQGEQAIRFLMLRRHRQSVNAPAAGEYPIPVPHLDPAGGGSVYRRIHLLSANATNIRVQREGIDEYKVSKTVLQEQQKRAGRTPQTNHVCYDPVLDNVAQGRVFDTTSAPFPRGAGVRAATFFATFSGPETFVVETEELIHLGDY